MKKHTLPCLLMLMTFSSLAADSVDLTVKGKLVTGSCAPSLSNNGVVDFGSMSLADLSKTDTNQLGSKNITLTVTCDSAMLVSWMTVDNRMSSVASSVSIVNAGANGQTTAKNSAIHYGLGKTADGVNIGAYTIVGPNGGYTADGSEVDWISNSNDTEWLPKVEGFQDPKGGRKVTAAAIGTLVPIAAQSFVYPLKITAAIQGTDALNITDKTSLDGSATISLIYL
ncbi:DUF1120 domain-containing protein [Enterobacter ludwigii]